MPNVTSKIDHSQLTREKVDIILINPSIDFKKDAAYLEKLRVDSEVPRQQSPQLGVAYMIAVGKRAGLKIKYLDMVASRISIDEVLQYIKQTSPSLVGFTAYTVQIKSAGFIAREIKKLSSPPPICVGGAHASVIPKDTLEEFKAFDFVITGEGEETLIQSLEQIKTGKPLSAIHGVVTRDKIDFTAFKVADLETSAKPLYYDSDIELDDLPFPAWEEFDLSLYPGADPHLTKLELPMSTSRGCPTSCIFCVRPFGRNRRKRSIDSIIAEIEHNIEVYGAEAIYFCDETFIISHSWSAQLFNKMIERGLHEKIRWSCAMRVDIENAEIFQLMKDSGCYYVFFGFEHGDDEMLKRISKRATVAQSRQSVRWAKEAGIGVCGAFILGLPGETEETAMKSINLGKELDLYSTTFPIAVPFPGTHLIEAGKKNEFGLRILSTNWDEYGKQYPGVMDSEHLPIEKLRELQKYAYDLIPKKSVSELAPKALEKSTLV